MIGSESFTIAVTGGTPGADSNTYKLFDSTVSFAAGQMRTLGISRLTFDVKNSAAGTLNAYRSVDKGTNWDQFDSKAVAAAAAGSISGPYDYPVDSFTDVKLEWVNGGSAQTTWRAELSAIVGDRAAAV